jgi:hypothetical protein
MIPAIDAAAVPHYAEALSAALCGLTRLLVGLNIMRAVPHQSSYKLNYAMLKQRGGNGASVVDTWNDQYV